MKFPWTRQPASPPSYSASSDSSNQPKVAPTQPTQGISLADRLGAEFMPRHVCCRCQQSRLRGQLLLQTGANGAKEWICPSCLT